MSIENIRVLIAEADASLANRMSRYLSDSGFKTKIVTEAYLLPKALLEWRPQFLFIDLLFPGFYAQKCLKFLGERQLLGEKGIYVVVMSHHNAELNVHNCLAAGADDYMVKPIKLIDVLQRLTLLSQSKKYNFSAIADQSQQKLKNYFHMVQLLARAVNQEKEVHPLRFELLQMISLALRAVRTSVIQCNGERNRISVINSSDDPQLRSLKLDLDKYPEIQYVLRTEKPIFIESVENDHAFSFIKDNVKSIQFDSMMVLPLHDGSALQGCLSIRMPKDCKQLNYYDIKTAEIAAQLLAITWKFPNQDRLARVA